MTLEAFYRMLAISYRMMRANEFNIQSNADRVGNTFKGRVAGRTQGIGCANGVLYGIEVLYVQGEYNTSMILTRLSKKGTWVNCKPPVDE